MLGLAGQRPVPIYLIQELRRALTVERSSGGQPVKWIGVDSGDGDDAEAFREL